MYLQKRYDTRIYLIYLYLKDSITVVELDFNELLGSHTNMRNVN